MPLNLSPRGRSVLAQARFRERLAELGATPIYEEWRGTKAPHRVLCIAGHECAPWPMVVLRDENTRICLICEPRDKSSLASEVKFRARLAALGATPAYEAWKGARARHAVVCVAGHDCAPIPNSLDRPGRGICNVCSRRDSKTSEAKFRARLAELGATPAYEAWLGARKPHEVVCAAGHRCSPSPNSVARGQGICPECAGQWDAFYVVRNPGSGVVKFGVTSGNPRPRLGNHAREGFTEVLRTFVDLPEAWASGLERELIRLLRLSGTAPTRGREYYPEAALQTILYTVDNWLADDDPRTSPSRTA